MQVDRDFQRSSLQRLSETEPIASHGVVRACSGQSIEAAGIQAGVGALCSILDDTGTSVPAEVIGYQENATILMPLSWSARVRKGAPVRVERSSGLVPNADSALGRVLDALGNPLDARAPVALGTLGSLNASPPPPLERAPIDTPLDLGVRAIDSFCTAGRGMRLGIFAGSGVGKSSLLGQIVRGTKASVCVIALVGERGREVGEFLERDLGPAIEKSTVVVATSDEVPLLRIRAAHLATALAEQHRDAGRDVLLVMDSLTRYCMALREVGLARGEPPATRGYTPSIWSQVPRLVERAGNQNSGGSITGIYSVLVEGDDPNEPIADLARSVLDGHIQLSRELASSGMFPAIDILESVSRVMEGVTDRSQQALATRVRELLATYRRVEDLVQVGAYVAGSDASVDTALELIGPIRNFLRQGREELDSISGAVQKLTQLFESTGARA